MRIAHMIVKRAQIVVRFAANDTRIFPLVRLEVDTAHVSSRVGQHGEGGAAELADGPVTNTQAKVILDQL